MKEKDLKVYDVFKTPNGNLFIKMTEDHSIAIGAKGEHEPHAWDLDSSQYVKRSDITNVKKVGEIVFDKPAVRKPPTYVRLGRTALCLRGKEYYRHGGEWGVGYRYVDGKLISWHPNMGQPQLHRKRLIRISKKEWKEDNKGYV